MGQRQINLYKEEENEVMGRNKKNAWIAFAILVILTIIMIIARSGVIAIMFLVAFIFFMLLIINRGNMREFEEKRLKMCIKSLNEKYGDYSLKIGEVSIESMILVFPNVDLLVINGSQIRFNEIIDFNINDMSSYRTSTSTESMIGRGAVGGLMFGGVGALAGANTASTTTVKENNRYKFNIVLDDFANPNFTCMIYNDEDASKLYSILKLIVEKNMKNYNSI